MIFRRQTERTNILVTLLTFQFTSFVAMCLTFWINQSCFAFMEGNYLMSVIYISNMFSYAEFAKVDLAKFTVAFTVWLLQMLQLILSLESIYFKNIIIYVIILFCNEIYHDYVSFIFLSV